MEKLFPYRVRKRASGWRKAKGIIDGIFTMEMKTLWYGLWGSTDSIKLRKVDCAWNMRGERDWASIRTGNNGIQIFEWFMMRCWARFFSASPRKPGGNKSFAFTAARRNEAFVCAKTIASSRGASVEKFNQIKCFINHSALLPSPRSTFVSKEFAPTCFIDSVRSWNLTRSRDAALKSRFTRLWSPENWLRYSDAAACVVKGPTSFSKLVSPSS